MTREDRFDVFLSYARSDGVAAAELNSWLRAHGFRRALLRAICQGPRPLPAVLRNSPETPSAMSAARRRPGVFHWRQRAARNRKRTQRVRAINTSGVSQKPK